MAERLGDRHEKGGRNQVAVVHDVPSAGGRGIEYFGGAIADLVRNAFIAQQPVNVATATTTHKTKFRPFSRKNHKKEQRAINMDYNGND